MNLSKHVKFRKVADPTDAGTGAVNSTAVDMAGYDGVLFLTSIGTANANNTINAAQGAQANGGDAADLEGTKVTPGDDNSGAWLDVYKPADRYVRLEVARGASTTVGDIWAILYQGRILPEAAANLVTDELIGELHISPDEGTA